MRSKIHPIWAFAGYGLIAAVLASCGERNSKDGRKAAGSRPNSSADTTPPPTRANFELWLKTKPNAKIYRPAAIAGAIHEAVASQPRSGPAHEIGRRAVDPKTGEMLYVPNALRGETPFFTFGKPEGAQKWIWGNFEFKTFWDRPLNVVVINRLRWAETDRPLSRSEYDVARIAQFWKATADIAVTTGAFREKLKRMPKETIVVDLRAELATDPPLTGYERDPYG